MRTRRLALTEGVLAGTLFGTAAIFIRYLPGVDAFFIAFWRLIVACSVLMLVLGFWGRSSGFRRVKENLRELFLLGLFLALHFIFFVSAVKDTTILNATVLVNTTPIFSVLVSTFLFRIAPSRLAVFGISISFAGVLIIVYGETLGGEAFASSGASLPGLKGDVEALLAALVESFYLNYGRKVRREMAILPTMLLVYIFTAVAVFILGFASTWAPPAVPVVAETILPIVGLGILPTAIAHTLYFSSLSNLKSFETATLALLEPVGATLMGISLFWEMPRELFVLGAALVLLGILFVLKEKTSASG